MTMERILLQTIKFDLQVDHPYTYLIKYAKCLKGTVLLPFAADLCYLSGEWDFIHLTACEQTINTLFICIVSKYIICMTYINIICKSALHLS